MYGVVMYLSKVSFVQIKKNKVGNINEKKEIFYRDY